MTDKQPEALRQAAWLKKEGDSCQRHYDLGVLIERQHTELETLRAKLKTYEDLGDAGSDVQLLRMGYAAARLEIESLRKEHAGELAAAYMCGAGREKELAAQQPGAAYAAPQFPDHPEPMVMDWSAIEISVIAQYGRDMYEAGKRQSHGHPYPTIDDLCARIKAADDAAADSDYMLDSNDCIAVLRGEWTAPLAMDKPERASHGQAPAGASKFAGVIAVQRSVAESDPSDAYMVGLYNGMSMMDANYRNLTDWEPMGRVPKPSPTAQAAESVPAVGASAAPKLRAMAINYPDGASWDKLDAQTCMHGALEIEALRAARAPAQSVTAPADGWKWAPEALRFTKKPVTIEAIQWTGENLREVITFTDGPPDTRSHHAGMAWEAYADLVARDGLKIYTLEGKMLANRGDWIIRGVKGEMYPCKDEIFRMTYEPAVAHES